MCVYTSSVHKTMKANETCHSGQELAQCINSVNTIIKSHMFLDKGTVHLLDSNVEYTVLIL